MSKVRLASLVVTLALFAGMVYVARIGEQGIEKRQQIRATQSDFWDCSVLPKDNVLRRVYIKRIIFDHDPDARATKRNFLGLALTPYIAARVEREELVEDLLKTPSSRERNCMPLRSS